MSLSTEKCLPIKIELAELACDISRQYGYDVLETMVTDGNFIENTLKLLKEMIPKVRQWQREYFKLIYNQIWAIGTLVNENERYADEFIQKGGI